MQLLHLIHLCVSDISLEITSSSRHISLSSSRRLLSPSPAFDGPYFGKYLYVVVSLSSFSLLSHNRAKNSTCSSFSISSEAFALSSRSNSSSIYLLFPAFLEPRRRLLRSPAVIDYRLRDLPLSSNAADASDGGHSSRS